MTTSEKYIPLIKEGLKEYAIRLRRQKFIFMQDGARAHLSKESKQFFKNEGFQPMEWPPNSPDLNPIENIWSVIKKKLWERREEVKNEEDIWRIKKEIWYKLNPDLFKKIYMSLPKQCEKVIFSKVLRIKTH